MLFPFRMALCVVLGGVAAYVAVSLLFRLLVGLFGLILSLALPLLIVGAISYVLLRVFAPNSLRMGRLGR